MSILITTSCAPVGWDGSSLFIQNTICLSTKTQYASEVKLFARWVNKRVIDVTFADLLSYKEFLEEEELKPASIKKKLAILRRLFSFLHDQGFLPRNPASGLKLPKVEDISGRDVLSLEECNRLIATVDTSALRGKRDLAIIALMLLNGLRSCECVRANVGDLRQSEGYWILRVHGKGGREADTRIRDDVYKAIQAYLETRGEVEATDPLFIGTNHRSGTRMTTRTVQYMVKKYYRKAGVDRPNLVCHSLRHSAITLVICSGASILSAQEFARHSDPKTTLRYIHNREAMKKHAVMLHPVHIRSSK